MKDQSSTSEIVHIVDCRHDHFSKVLCDTDETVDRGSDTTPLRLLTEVLIQHL